MITGQGLGCSGFHLGGDLLVNFPMSRYVVLTVSKGCEPVNKLYVHTLQAEGVKGELTKTVIMVKVFLQVTLIHHTRRCRRN